MDDDIPYLLLTPGPLTTSRCVKQAMLRDYCTWDDEYHEIVNDIRRRLCDLAGGGPEWTSVLMQGSGTFAVEATVGSCMPPDGKLLVLANGAYGSRIAQIAARLRIPHALLKFSEVEPVDSARVEAELSADGQLTHVAMVHCETTTGIMNPAAEVGELCRRHGKVFILDAMSSFGGIPMNVAEVGAHYVISSANKCIQGVPGFGFVIAHRPTFERTEGWARSLSLDLFDQWREMEQHHGKWRYTSPTHVVRAFAQALVELDAEGGIPARAARYRENHRLLVAGMSELGFRALIAPEHQSPIITAFHYPVDPAFRFNTFYDALKARRFVIYPGKVSQADTFRIGTIGHVFPDDIRDLITAVDQVTRELALRVKPE
ncbi:MAG: 2-aminoethylphosphonate--pyruvate transaminase [Planctomycetia bacterium]|nr:2-aminoethylphosphonate--pyruvate transaminase [Planctomycetia bacterium]